MALIHNGALIQSGLNRYYGVFGSTGLRSVFERGGARKNFDSGQHAISGVTNKAAIPEGTRHPFSWKMGTKAGSLSSHIDASLSLGGAATILGGVTSPASATITFTVADAAGQLISSGEGAAAFAFSTNTPLLTASLAAIGEASFTLSASGAMGAEASAEGSASIVFSMAATIFPVDDTPPERTAGASFSITGALVPYAVGSMIGSTVDASVLTVDAIAAGVLAAALTTPISANIKKVNEITVQGTGATGDEWGP